MKLLIIGGTGLLSGAVVKEALKQKIEVTIVNRGVKSHNAPEGVNVIIADYRNQTLIESLLKDKYYDAAIDFICFNKKQIEYSISLLTQHCKQYIFISSACVYDYSKPGIKYEDADKVFNEWDYSVNKWDCECCLTEAARKKGFDYTIIRPCITFDDTRIPYGIAPIYGYHWTLVARILSGKPIIRWNGGTTKWNMMRVEDFSVGLVGIVGNPLAYNTAFNISGDNAYSWNDVVACIEDVIKKKVVFYDISSEEYSTLVPWMKGRIFGRSSDLLCNNEKIKELVPGYKMTYSLQSGIEKTIRGYIENNYQKGIDYVFDGQMDGVIRESCRIHGVNPSIYKLGFVNYLSSATIKDWIDYYTSSFYNVLRIGKSLSFKENLIRFVFKLIKRVLKIIRYIP